MSSLVFERIAQQRFGDGMLGVPLRHLYLTRPAISPGAEVFVPSYLPNSPVRPLSHVLLPTAVQLEVFEDLIAERGGH